MVERELLNVGELSVMLGFSRNHTYELIQRGEIPGVIRLGGRIRISRKAIEEMLGLSPALKGY